MKEHPRSDPQVTDSVRLCEDSPQTTGSPQVTSQDPAETPWEILRACPQDPAGERYGADMEEIWRRYGGDTEELPAFSTFSIHIIGVVQQPLSVCYQGIALPLLWKLLAKKGNSNTKECTDMIGKFVKLFGKGCIKAVVADREFFGKDWLAYLQREYIPFHIRIRDKICGCTSLVVKRSG
jgi:hypothetical protein